MKYNLKYLTFYLNRRSQRFGQMEKTAAMAWGTGT